MSELLENGVELHYEGPVTLDGSQSVHLSGRAGGIAAMLWEALGEAGWVGEQTSVRMTVAVRIGISPCPAPSAPIRRVLDGGWTDDHGVRWHQQVGPLSGRSAAGFRLLEDELQPGELTVGERILRTAAIEAGRLAGDSSEKTEIPDVRITVAVARRNPRWEAYGGNPGWPDLPAQNPSRHNDQVDETETRELLALALEVAARRGDPDPVLVEHAYGTRFDVTRTTGSTVFSDTPSCIFVMEGRFRADHPRPANHRTGPADPEGPEVREPHSYPFQTVVIDVQQRRVMDLGLQSRRPDLTPLGRVVRDRPR